MSAAREPDQADFDLERFVDMFDEALTSQDPRVMNALRSLMMIVTLTRPESRNNLHDRNSGPLRRLYEDVNHLNRRMHDMADELRSVSNAIKRGSQPYRWEVEDKYSMEAASQMSQQIDQDVLLQMKAAAMNKIQGLK